MESNLVLTPSMEDYLESILKIETINNYIKIKDIAEDLSVQMPSVIGALKTLRGKELVIYEKSSKIQLTEKGKMIAKTVLERHEAIAAFLQTIFLFPEDEAQETACQIEHAIKSGTAKQFSNLTAYLNTNIIGKLMSLEEWKKIINTN